MRFNIESLKERTAKVKVDDIDFDSFRTEPLSEPVLRCLRYMHDVEHHTICYLRDVLVTDAHLDHDITSFMTFWAFEEWWHGEALGQVLAAHGESSDDRVQSTRDHQSVHDQLMPVYTWVANKVTRHVPAVHMTWGAINEWTAQAAYARLAQRADHPVLSELLARIRKQEGRHIDFYASQARTRLDGSPTAQKLTRAALRKFWTPVGAGLMDDAEVKHMSGFLFGGDEGQKYLDRIDRQVDRLPGLSGLSLVTTAANELIVSYDEAAVAAQIHAHEIDLRDGATATASDAEPDRAEPGSSTQTTVAA
jgi:hypothetical protein